MRFSLVILAATAPVALSTPAQNAEPIGGILEKRARCVNDGFFSVLVNNAVSASSFCSSSYVPTAVVKAVATSTAVITSTIRTITVKTTPTVFVTSAISTTTVFSTYTVPAPVKRGLLARDIQQRDNALPDYVDAFVSVMASSACSCLLSTVTYTSTSTRIVNSVTRATGTFLGTTTITNIATIPLVTESSVITTTQSTTDSTSTSVTSCPYQALEDSYFETSGDPFTDSDVPGSNYEWVKTSDGYPCIGNGCGFIYSSDTSYGGNAIAEINVCSGSSYLVTATVQVIIQAQTNPEPLCNIFLVTRTQSQAVAQVATLRQLTADGQMHVITGVFTADPTTVYFSIDINCATATSPFGMIIDNVSVLKQ